MTFSINTNNAAMAALESLSMTQSALQSTQNQVSTGQRVSSAADNPAIFAIAQQMNGNISGLSAVSDSLSFGAQVVNTALSAANGIFSTLTTLQNTVTAAGQTGIDQATMQSKIADALNSINTFARNSTFNGINILTSSTDAGSTVTNENLNIIDGLQGSQLTVNNQASAIGAGAASLTDALGLTSGATGKTVISSGTAGTGQILQNLLSSNSGGVNIKMGATLTASGDFAAGQTVKLTNGDGSTTTFEFTDGSTALTTVPTANNNVVAVIVNTGSESTNQMVGDLATAMNKNGYNAVVQNDGSINVTGQGVSASAGNAAGGIQAGTTLSATQALISTIQGAITKMTKVTNSLGSTADQISGMATFTKTLSDALTSGVGALTDADLSAESAKLTSLQTKQQLAIQSLSIANSQSQSILSLFR